MKRKSIVIIDDHTLIRQMWVKLLTGHLLVRIIGDAGKIDEVAELIREKKPNLVLLDIKWESESGMEALQFIHKYSSETKIIVVSIHNQPAYVKKIFHLGANAYVTKFSTYDEIDKAIAEVLKGNLYLSAEIKTMLVNNFIYTDNKLPDIKYLSIRELEVLDLIKMKLSSKEISKKLFISIRTVEVHRYNILKKLKLKNTDALLNFISNSEFA